MMRVTIACPEALIGDANQLALCLGLGPEDAQTYGAACWQDAAGNRYAVASAIVSSRFADDAAVPLAEPPWGADMDAAARAQALILVDEPAGPGHIAAVFGDDAMAALAVLGLTRVPDEGGGI